MYCRKCYTNVQNADATCCPKCRRAFDPQNPKTFLRHPFPDRSQILFRILATTLLGILFAFLVSWFQLVVNSAFAQFSSGH